MKRIIFSLALLSFAAQASAQHWTKITSDPGYALTPYFLNKDIGFSFAAGLYFNAPQFVDFNWWPLSPLKKTIDGGKTWTTIPFFDSVGRVITQLCFVSLDHGYASTMPE